MAKKKYVLDSLNLAGAQEKLVRAALAESQTIMEAAQKMGLTRHTLRRLMTKYGIKFESVHQAYATRAEAS